jgi:hypothetical protein
MAQPSQPESKVPTVKTPSSKKKDVLRLVCGWNEKKNTYLYRDEVINPPPIYGNGPEKVEKVGKAERVSKRPKKESAKVRLSRGKDVKIFSAGAKPRRERAGRRGKVSYDPV